MKTVRRKTGDLGERLAAIFLERKGFTILDRNYLKPWGEIDIVALRKGVIHFVEVKTISRESMPPEGSREMVHRPEEELTALKLRKVARTASLYMEGKRDTREYQIDAVTVILDRERRKAHCTYYPQVL